MTTSQRQASDADFRGNILLYVARTIAFLWAGFWLVYGMAASVAEGPRLGGLIMRVLFPGLIFLTLAAFTWRWPLHGAIVMMLCGVVVLIGYPLLAAGKYGAGTILAVLGTMGLPPFAAGVLFWLHARRHQPRFPFRPED